MKISILTLALAVVSFTSVHAQQEYDTKTVVINRTEHRQHMMLGLKAGLNYSNVFDTKGEDFHDDARVGFAGGAFLSIPVSRYFGIQPEILYSKKGFHATGRILGSTYDVIRITTFLDVPLLLAIKPNEFITVLVGPQYSYLLKQKDVFKSASSSIAQEKEMEDADIRKNILGFTTGIDLNMRHATFGARIGWDLFNNNSDGSTTTPRYRNTWLQGTVGYRF